MICANCGTENEAGSKFCIECAIPLASACPTCGKSNLPGAKFCGECGTPLGTESTQAPGTIVRTGPAAPTPVAERRLVSILFADLVGSTALAEGRDPEETRDLLTRYFELCRDVITRYGGTVEKFIGDAVMAVWGAPTAHEDDAERAVRAGLDLVDAVKALGPTVQARAGVLTGEAAVTIGATNQGMVAGDLVNTASRLQSVAPAGAVLVGESTQRAANKAIAFEEVGEQILKGKTSPVPAWRALRVVAEVGGRNRSETREAPFVGRVDELRLLKDLFHATTREGRARLVSVIGPAGIGKTRLAWELEKYLDGLVERVWFHDGRSPAYGEGISFWALGEMVRRRAGLAETDDEATTRTKLAEVLALHVEDGAERDWIEPALLALLGFASSVGSDQLFGAWRTFFERLAATAPVVMVFEDLHFADSGLLDFVDHLLEWSRNVPIYVVTLARPELLEKRENWGAGKRNFVSVYLEPLPVAAMRELLLGLVPGLPDAAIKAIVARADGIPLYAIETIRMMLANGRLELIEGVYRPIGDLATLAVPETLTALIASRLDGLDAASRTLVSDAAVLGQSFTLAGLSAVSGIDEARLEPLLRGLVRRELLAVESDPRSPERGQHAFVQALIREVAYNILARPDRKTRHLAAARFFESLGTDELAGGLAGHYLAAHANAPAGTEADALASQARIALKGAAERAATLGAHRQALAYHQQAEAITVDGDHLTSIWASAGRAAEDAGEMETAQAYYERVLAVRRDGVDRSAAAHAAANLARAQISAGQIAAALDLAEIASAQFPPSEGTLGSVLLAAELARAYMRLGRDDEAIVTADRALVAAEQLEVDEPIVESLTTKGTSLTSVGRQREGLALLRAAISIAESRGFVQGALRARQNLWFSDTDNPSAAVEVTRPGLDLAKRLGLGEWVLDLTEVVCLPSLSVTADWASVESALRDQEDADLRPPYDLIFAAMRLFLDGMRTPGDVPQTIEELAELVLRAEEFGDPQVAFNMSLMKGWLELAGGRASDALQSARVVTTTEFGASWQTWGAALGIKAAIWSRDRAALDEMEATILGARGRWPELLRLEIQASRTALDGTPQRALTAYRDVFIRWKELAIPVQHASSVIGAAQLLGARPELVEALAEARAILGGIDARTFLDRLDEAVREPNSAAVS